MAELAVVVGVVLGAVLLRAVPRTFTSAGQRVVASVLVLAQPLAAFLAQRMRAPWYAAIAWALVGFFFVTAPILFKRAGEDLDRHTDAVAAGTRPPSRLRLAGMALFPLAIIVAGAVMLLVVDLLVTRALPGASTP